MKNFPLYENLDTSFINFAALVRFLRARRFVGSLRVELEDYEADLDFTGDSFTTREHDRLAGRIAEGDEAFERLLIRARAPGGRINVFEAATVARSGEQTRLAGSGRQPSSAPPVAVFEEAPPIPKPAFPTAPVGENFARPEVVRPKVNIVGEKPFPPPENLNVLNNADASNKIDIPPPAAKALDPQDFEFTNHVEELARRKRVSPEDWQQLLNLIAELLVTIDRSLARANLNFSNAFAKARTEISADYPFLNPAAGVFDYANERLTMRETVSAKIFAAGINESLRRILGKLAQSSKYAEVYRDTVQNIHTLAADRRPLYDKFFIMPQPEKTVGAKNTLAA